VRRDAQFIAQYGRWYIRICSKTNFSFKFGPFHVLGCQYLTGGQ